MKLREAKPNWKDFEAGKNLKPYQGLKLAVVDHVATLEEKAGKNLKPYQGLKRQYDELFLSLPVAGKNLKPYQGLKLYHQYSAK